MDENIGEYGARGHQAAVCGIAEDGIFKIVDPAANVADLLPGFDIFLMTSVPRSEGTPPAIHGSHVMWNPGSRN